MPIYDFYSPDNNKVYSFYARSLAQANRTPRCPDNPKFRMERVVSRFAVTGRAKETPESAGGPDDACMDAAFAEMEREFSGMDTDNPDPRQLARMMRKMSGLAGEKIPGEMEEMIRRMEAGEDPEKLEEEFGDAMGGDEMDDGSVPGGFDEPGEKGKRMREQFRRMQNAPVRDPALYEMRDYVES